MKRFFDVFFAAIGLLIASPVLAILTFMVWREMGRPIVFRQTRPGLYAQPFSMIKFRTMKNATGPEGNILPDADRLTSFGRGLRATSLDELPSLWNVLKGDMSFVGPRPLLMQYLPLYNPRQARRHLVRPGITGWAQVNGRNAISWEEKFELDLWYVENQTLRLDLKIMGLTILKVCRREGVNAEGEATMMAFEGSKSQATDESADLNLSRK